MASSAALSCFFCPSPLSSKKNSPPSVFFPSAAYPRPAKSNRLSVVGALQSTAQGHENKDTSSSVAVDVHDLTNQNQDKGTSVQQRRAGLDHISPFGRLIDDPLFPMSSTLILRQMMDTMDRMLDDSLFPGSRRHSSIRSPWDVKNEEDEIKIRLDMPGLSKEQVKVWVEDDVLFIKGQHNENHGNNQSSTYYNTHFLLPQHVEKENIKAELNNGVLFLTIPKSKLHNRNLVDVQVQ